MNRVRLKSPSHPDLFLQNCLAQVSALTINRKTQTILETLSTKVKELLYPDTFVNVVVNIFGLNDGQIKYQISPASFPFLHPSTQEREKGENDDRERYQVSIRHHHSNYKLKIILKIFLLKKFLIFACLSLAGRRNPMKSSHQARKSDTLTNETTKLCSCFSTNT